MALLASSFFPSTLNIKLHGFLVQLNGHRRVSPKCGMKITMAQFQFGEPNKIRSNSISSRRGYGRTPDYVKGFPWKKAENLLLQRLLFVGKKALKLSLVAFLSLAVCLIFIYSISRNQELMTPFSLIVGCLITDFLKETNPRSISQL